MITSMAKQAFGSRSEVFLVVFMVGILLVLFAPIPAVMLDFLLILNFSLALLVLLLTFYMDKPLGFSTFPALLLIATLFRLSLNVASTRLILSDADAGQVIDAVGAYVVGGNYVIGLVVFLILIVVQYVVVTNGAQRVAEVAARFTLDSMPGKQMSIDADMNMGLIDEKEAQRRRKEIEKEANFYGAMDGASKFVKGDAIAGIIITLINIIGGLTIGLTQQGLTWGDALHQYTLLTVGDGIVTQIPALIISTATGIIVTRAATDAQFGEEITRQITKYPKSLVVIAIALACFAFLPGVPTLPVITILGFALALSYVAFKRHETHKDELEDEPAEAEENSIYDELSVEPIEISVGSGLVELVGGDDGLLMEKVQVFRKSFAQEIGFVLPKVRLMDSSRLSDNEYALSLFGSQIARGEIEPDKVLAITNKANRDDLEGIKTKDPTYGLPALWIDESKRDAAKQLGYTLVDPATVFVTHLTELFRNHAHELLSRNETEVLILRVKKSQPTLYEELVPNTMSISDVQKVLQGLLMEGVSVRNIEKVFETLVDCGQSIKDTEELVEQVRKNLGRTICDPLKSKNDELEVLTFDPALEQSLQAGLRSMENRVTMIIDPLLTERLLKQLVSLSENMMKKGSRPVLLCSPNIRRHIKRLSVRLLPQLSVLSLLEVPSNLHISSFGVVQVEQKRLKMVSPKEEAHA